jgi:hypothetical protein
MRRSFLAGCAGEDLRREVAVEQLFDNLPDVSRVEQLQVREAFEKNERTTSLSAPFPRSIPCATVRPDSCSRNYQASGTRG